MAPLQGYGINASYAHCGKSGHLFVDRVHLGRYATICHSTEGDLCGNGHSSDSHSSLLSDNVHVGILLELPLYLGGPAPMCLSLTFF